MNLVPLNIPQGISKRGTEYQSAGEWWDSNLVRTYDGAVGPIMGWKQFSTTTITGKGRACIAWRQNTGNRWVAVGTEQKLYVCDASGVKYDITPAGLVTGSTDETGNLGFGGGTFGSGTFGDARPDTGSRTPASVWDLDTFGGQYLFGCLPDDGHIVEWTLDTGTAAAVVSNAPTSCYGVACTPQRMVLALGPSGVQNRLQWSDQDNATTWTATAANQAGDVDLDRGKVLCAKRLVEQMFVLTDQDAHVLTYVGLPLVYTPKKVAEGAGGISKKCLITAGNFAAWWSKSGIWSYNGAASPVDCPFWDDVQRRLNTNQTSKITGYHNTKYNEFWWFFPSTSSTEIDSYIFWNYKLNVWWIGSLVRLSATEAGPFQNPFAVGNDGYVYVHESGHAYDSVVPYARSGPLELNGGQNVVYISGVIPDEITGGDVGMTFRTRFYPNATETVSSSFTFDSTGKCDVRGVAGRQVEITVTAVGNNDWRWGKPRLDVRLGGQR